MDLQRLLFHGDPQLGLLAVLFCFHFIFLLFLVLKSNTKVLLSFWVTCDFLSDVTKYSNGES